MHLVVLAIDLHCHPRRRDAARQRERERAAVLVGCVPPIMASIGMMDAAFFVGRREILDWANATFAMRLERIEETANGAVLCQILDAIYPDGAVPMGKVRWDARTEPEMVSNYKLVQAVFTAKGVDKHIDVAKLVRAKYQDNLECMQVSSAARSTVDGAYGRSPARPRARARRPSTHPRRHAAPARPPTPQWAMNFFKTYYNGAPYDARARRAKGRGADSVPAFATTGAVPVAARAGGSPAAAARPARPTPGHSVAPASSAAQSASSAGPAARSAAAAPGSTAKPAALSSFSSAGGGRPGSPSAAGAPSRGGDSLRAQQVRACVRACVCRGRVVGGRVGGARGWMGGLAWQQVRVHSHVWVGGA